VAPEAAVKISNGAYLSPSFGRVNYNLNVESLGVKMKKDTK
jgi:hypothetical protein